jgi:predicted RNA binding protein YcfA (HicA-like mRNA interferase family)
VSRREKLIARIRARPPEADFGDVHNLLGEFGWQMDRQKGSHVSFTKAGERSIVVPVVRGRKVKRTYLTEICERLGLDD